MQLPKIGGSQRNLRGGQRQKAGAVVWQWVATFKEAVPPGPQPSLLGTLMGVLMLCVDFKKWQCRVSLLLKIPHVPCPI